MSFGFRRIFLPKGAYVIDPGTLAGLAGVIAALTGLLAELRKWRLWIRRAVRAACLLTAKPKSLPLDANDLRLFGQKTIGDRGFECLADGFLMRRMGDQNDRDRAVRTNFDAGPVALHD